VIGDLTDLKNSIERDGLLNPIILNEHKKLIAGSRRYSAFKELDLPTIPCRIIPGLSTDDALVIELVENTARKEFEWHEELALKFKIHNLWKVQNSTAKKEWGYRETAAKLKVSIGGLSSDLAIAEAITFFPELTECKNKAQARENYKKMQSQVASIQAMDNLTSTEKENLNKLLSGQKIEIKIPQAIHDDKMPVVTPDVCSHVEQSVDVEVMETACDDTTIPQHNYMVGTWQECLNEIPENTIGYAELDPPYAIDFNENYGKSQDINTTVEQDWTVDQFNQEMYSLLHELFVKMQNNSWVLCWTGKEHWQNLNAIAREIGFHTQDPGVWTKDGGSVNKPSVIMVSCYETFLLFRKGEANFNVPSFPNVVHCPTVHSTARAHQWEKPLKLYNKFSEALAKPKTIFFAPFAGSGNSMLSAAIHDMIPIGSDTSNKYITYFYTNMKKHFAI
jgi:DNA modification methylase